MFTTPFICHSCGNPNVAHASLRFRNICDGWATEEERFALIDKKSDYSKYSALVKRGNSPEDAFKQLGIMSLYNIFEGLEGTPVDAQRVYRLLGINRFCCMRSVTSLPVWPNYHHEKPAGSQIKLDEGTRMRFVKREGNRFHKQQVYLDQYGEPIVPSVKVDIAVGEEQAKKVMEIINFLLVSDLDIENLKV